MLVLSIKTCLPSSKEARARCSTFGVTSFHPDSIDPIPVTSERVHVGTRVAFVCIFVYIHLAMSWQLLLPLTLGFQSLIYVRTRCLATAHELLRDQYDKFSLSLTFFSFSRQTYTTEYHEVHDLGCFLWIGCAMIAHEPNRAIVGFQATWWVWTCSTSNNFMKGGTWEKKKKRKLSPSQVCMDKALTCRYAQEYTRLPSKFASYSTIDL